MSNYKAEAALLYVNSHPSAAQQIKIIELLIQGFSLDDIIRNSRKNNIHLGVAGISSAYYKYKKHLKIQQHEM